MITNTQLEDMSKNNIEQINRKDLVDISAIYIKQEVAHSEKIIAFLAEIKNPYCFLCGSIPVRVCFLDGGLKLSQILQEYFIRMKQG